MIVWPGTKVVLIVRLSQLTLRDVPSEWYERLLFTHYMRKSRCYLKHVVISWTIYTMQTDREKPVKTNTLYPRTQTEAIRTRTQGSPHQLDVHSHNQTAHVPPLVVQHLNPGSILLAIALVAASGITPVLVQIAGLVVVRASTGVLRWLLWLLGLLSMLSRRSSCLAFLMRSYTFADAVNGVGDAAVFDA